MLSDSIHLYSLGRRDPVLYKIATESEKRISEKLVSLVDILFAVAVGDSIFTLIFSNNLIKDWPTFADIIKVSNMALLVAYIAVILSWIGYHNMIDKFPYKGTIRFWIDILIVFIYIIFIYSKENLSMFLIWFIFIFLLYGIGDWIRDREYNIRVSQRNKSFVFTGIFIIVYIFYTSLIQVNSISWLVLLLNLLLLVLYRQI